jgi:hypothetical protein
MIIIVNDAGEVFATASDGSTWTRQTSAFSEGEPIASLVASLQELAASVPRSLPR